MSDFTAGPPSGADDGGSDTRSGGPPTVLLAALGAAALIAVGLIAAFASLGGDDSNEPLSDGPSATSTTTGERVLLTVSVDGSGIGRVQITPSDVSCNSSCEYKFRAGRRVTATAEPSSRSTFEGWGEACSGEESCSFVMDRPRALSATFAEKPAADPLCEGVPPEEQDPTCLTDDEPGTSTQPREPGPDCLDGRDNDDDGLTDTAQDPDCEESGSESGTSAPPGPSTPPDNPTPPPAPTNECTDGRDNDGDGLTDREQDPDCEKGRSESG